jgi:hypothetical protein
MVRSINLYLKIDRFWSQKARKIKKNSYVVDKIMVGDTGFEPVTSTVCKKHKKKGKRDI